MYTRNISLIPVVLLFAISMVYANELEGQMNEIQVQSEGAGEAINKALKREARLVPIVLPISNPTIGVGLGGGLLYMHEKGEDADPNDPTTMTGVFGMYTDTDSWAFGGFHSGSYRDDSIRVSVPIVHSDFSLKYYGIGENSPFRDNPLDYDATGNLFIPEASFELPINNWFVGCQYRIIDINTEFGTADPGDDIPGLNTRQKTAGIGLISVYDTRNSNLWPDRGSWLDISMLFNGEYAGGDYNYTKTTIKWAQYFPVLESLTIVYRLDGQYVGGSEAPFWDLARVRLRGYSSGQYLDNAATTAQAELRWNAYGRWYITAFGGAGWIGDTIADLGDADANFAGGTGFRYMLVEDQKLSAGIDLAYGDGDTQISVYFQIGDWLAN